MSTWAVSSEYKPTFRTIICFTDEDIESYIYREAFIHNIPRERILIESFTDEWFAYSLDDRILPGRRKPRRRLLMHLTCEGS